MESQEFCSRIRLAVEAIKRRQELMPKVITYPIILGDQIEDAWVVGQQRRMAQDGPYPVFAAAHGSGWCSRGGAGAVTQQMGQLLETGFTEIRRGDGESRKERYIDVTNERVVNRIDLDTMNYDAHGKQLEIVLETMAEIQQHYHGLGAEIEFLLVLCDYGKGALWNPIDLGVIAPLAGVWVDPHPKSQPWLYENATLVSCSADEVRMAEDAFVEGSQRPVMIRRNGKKGSSLSYDGYQEIDIPAVHVQPVRCTVACGDAYMAGMVSAACALGNIHSDETLLTAACFGSLMASMKVPNWGMCKPVCLGQLTDEFIAELDGCLMDGTTGSEFPRYGTPEPMWTPGSPYPTPEEIEDGCASEQDESDSSGPA